MVVEIFTFRELSLSCEFYVDVEIEETKLQQEGERGIRMLMLMLAGL